MIIFRLLRKRPHDTFGTEGDGGGAAIETTPAVADVTAPVAAPAPAEPGSMLDAMYNRDPASGRFAPKQADGTPAAPAQPGAAAQTAQQATPAAPKPAEPAQPEDLTAMPEGLGAKAQERFQKLANGLRERDEQIQGLTSAVNYVQTTFQQHGITQPQFEQAAAVLGALNRGDFRTALSALDEQRRQIALQLGEPLPGVDALSDFPDLRQKVDTLHLTEADALEIARHRKGQQQAQSQQQAHQAQQQQTQQHQQAVASAQGAVDTWCKQMQRTDLDYPAIEALLLPEIPNLLQGVSPAQWPQIVQTQYRLIKSSGAAFRRTNTASAPAPAPLRPNGMGAGAQAPGTMFQAMFPNG